MRRDAPVAARRRPASTRGELLANSGRFGQAGLAGDGGSLVSRRWTSRPDRARPRSARATRSRRRRVCGHDFPIAARRGRSRRDPVLRREWRGQRVREPKTRSKPDQRPFADVGLRARARTRKSERFLPREPRKSGQRKGRNRAAGRASQRRKARERAATAGVGRAGGDARQGDGRESASAFGTAADEVDGLEGAMRRYLQATARLADRVGQARTRRRTQRPREHVARRDRPCPGRRRLPSAAPRPPSHLAEPRRTHGSRHGQRHATTGADTIPLESKLRRDKRRTSSLRRGRPCAWVRGRLTRPAVATAPDQEPRDRRGRRG